jgi:hypothetical protein
MHTIAKQPTAPLSALAFVFTNAQGRIVFADRNFLGLAKREPNRPTLGETLQTALGIDAQSMAHLMQDVAQMTYFARRPLSIKTSTGTLSSLWGAGAAVYDQQNSFIGADILLAIPSSESRPPFPPLIHAEVLNSYLQQSLSEARIHRTKTFFQVYVNVQIDALQVLLARMGGPEMRNTLEHVVNAAATAHGIPIVMRDGHLEFFSKTAMFFNSYGALLRAALDYAVNAVGKRMVGQEIQAINRQIDPGLREFVTQLDLRMIFDA